MRHGNRWARLLAAVCAMALFLSVISPALAAKYPYDTISMDDVNMLAFMDLLKYQISSKETMDQLFFVTCDNRISRLLKYKMNGHGIELKELLENDFKQ